ncbi:hypothetical protein SAMN04488105_13010 [Salipiger thiooxidans]|uniref:Chromosome segregation ATPase n=1 Tax=Salipiger thiooxidans TaxID=282683 RepID=A0A1G7M7J3_9RHOB|nr:hypothetical protein [Salipiger thiooxidans]SDF57199.1 hypothetical protein SAMN04488105_13010 [Salipiger thiooxidans]
MNAYGALLRVALAVVVLAAPAWSQEAPARSCAALSEYEAGQEADRLVALLQIANFRADLPEMAQYSAELELYMNSCDPDAQNWPPLVCGYQCYTHLTREKLFRATDLVLLSARSGIGQASSVISPQARQQSAEEGLALVERGLNALLRSQTQPSPSADAEEAEDLARFRTFVRQKVALSALKIQLLISQGDIWYQTLSEARMQRLNYLVSQALDPAVQTAADGNDNLAFGGLKYEEALWALIEIKLDLPSESTYDDLRADLLKLELDLRARRDSLAKGYLFLNIDPEAFTTISFEDLRARLSQTADRLGQVEARIEEVIELWANASDAQASREEDAKRLVRGQQVNLLAHQIGKLETEAKVGANAIEAQVNALGQKQDTFEYRRRVRELEMALARQVAQLEGQQELIEARQELDLIVLNKERATDLRAELRWKISFEVLRLNLLLQIDALDGQVIEYQRQLQANATQLQDVANQRLIVQNQIEAEEFRIARDKAAIARIEHSKTEVSARKRDVTLAQICGIEQQLAFITDAVPITPMDGADACNFPAPQTIRLQEEIDAEICELRSQLADTELAYQAFLLQCVVADDRASFFVDLEDEQQRALDSARARVDDDGLCEGLRTQADLARDIYDAELAVLKRRRGDMAAQRAEVQAQLRFVERELRDFNGNVEVLQQMLQLAEMTLVGAAALPDVTIAAAGLSSGVYTSVPDGKNNALIAVAALRNQIDRVMRLRQIDNAAQQQIDQLQLQILQLNQALENISMDQVIKDLAFEQTRAQLARERTGVQSASAQAAINRSLIGLQCEAGVVTRASNVAGLAAEHARLRSVLEFQASETALLDNDIRQLRLGIQSHQKAIENHRLALTKLDDEEARLGTDNGMLTRLIENVTGRKDLVEDTQREVEGLAEQSEGVTREIEILRDQHEQALLALNDIEMRQLTDRINAETGFTEELVAQVGEAAELTRQRRALDVEMQKRTAVYLSAVQERETDMTELLSEIDDPEARRDRFLATQEMLSEVLRGIPDYIDTKRRYLELGNRLHHLMWRRYATVLTVIGDDPSMPQAYITSGDSLRALADAVDYQRFFDERQINIDMTRIPIPSGSGFVQSLAQTGSVDFQLSPGVRSVQDMADAGYLVLWDPAKLDNRQNMTLVDMFAAIDYGCNAGLRRNRYTLTHQGSGIVFRPVTEGASDLAAELVIGPPRNKAQTFLRSTTEDAQIDQILSYWSSDFAIRTFPPSGGPRNDPESRLRYLGAPLIGDYRLDAHPSDCAHDRSVITLYFVFASAA